MVGDTSDGLLERHPVNCWWVAATSDEVVQKPLSRVLLGQSVVMFRSGSNSVTALEDRCAHRWAPLSKGRLIGDEIACPYHGFRYDATGACTHVPTQSHVPGLLKVRSFPVREHGPFVWIWMGDPARASDDLLPALSWSTDPAYLRLRGYAEARCSYIAVQENLMDDAHFNYLHCPQHVDWREGPNLWPSIPTDILTTERSVTTVMRIINVQLAPVEAAAMGFGPGKRVNRLGRCTSTPPACYFAEWEFEDPDSADRSRSNFSLRGLHCMTPIGVGRCHWWWAYIQDYGHHAPRAFQSGWENILKQDREILEAIQARREQGGGQPSPPQVLVNSDRALGELRRVFSWMLESELPF